MPVKRAANLSIVKQERLEKVMSTHNVGWRLDFQNPSYKKFTEELLLMLFLEDLGSGGDITSAVSDLRNKNAVASVIARNEGIVSGLEEVDCLLKASRPNLSDPIRTVRRSANGSHVKKGREIAAYGGKATDLLSVERTLLNVIGRMSGIASLAKQMVKMAGNNVLVVPTRKTYWGLLDKRACFDGGAGTHRLNLSDAILIKDNHINAAGGINRALRLLSGNKVTPRFMEIEAESLGDVVEILKVYGSDRFKVPFFIMLDNMSPSEVKETVTLLRRSRFSDEIFLEVSGGIDLSNIKKYAVTGVDVISSGSMTHSAPWFDVSMEFAV